MCVAVVLVCAFSPSFSPSKIAVSVGVFIASTRGRCEDDVVVLASCAKEVREEWLSNMIANGGSDEGARNVHFVTGVPYSTQALKVGLHIMASHIIPYLIII